MSHKAGSTELHSDQSHGRRVDNRRNSVTTVAPETEHDCDQRYRQVKYELSEEAEVGSLWHHKLFIWRCVDVGEHINNRNDNRKTALFSHHSSTTSRTWNKTFWSFPAIQHLGEGSAWHISISETIFSIHLSICLSELISVNFSMEALITPFPPYLPPPGEHQGWKRLNWLVIWFRISRSWLNQ